MKFDVGILGTEPVSTIVAQARLAESLGYDTVWIADTHLLPQAPGGGFIAREHILTLFAETVMSRIV